MVNSVFLVNEKRNYNNKISTGEMGGLLYIKRMCRHVSSLSTNCGSKDAIYRHGLLHDNTGVIT